MQNADVVVFASVAVFMTVCVFLNGWRFARMTSNPFAGRTLFGQPIQGAELTVEQINRIGQFQMIAAPLMLVFFAYVISRI